MTLGELLVLSINPDNITRGSKHGICIVCSKETSEGIEVKDTVSGNFTGWSYFFSGNCMCPDCYHIFSDQIFRRRSWVASEKEGFKTFKNDEAINILFNPPEPPFFIYIAKIGQKQGWLSCLHKVAMNRSRYFFAHEKYDVPIFFEYEKAERYLEQVKRAFEYGIPKSEVMGGYFSTTTWGKAMKGGYESLLNEIIKNRKNPLWEVIVDVSRKPDDTGGEREQINRATGLLL